MLTPPGEGAVVRIKEDEKDSEYAEMSRRWAKVETRKVQGSTMPELFDY